MYIQTGDLSSMRDASRALDVVDVDGDGKIGLVDFIRFATRLKARWGREQFQPLLPNTGEWVIDYVMIK